MEKKPQVLSAAVPAIAWIIGLVLFVVSGFNLLLLAGLSIGSLCAKKNVNWAQQVSKSANLAWIIGFVGGLLGLLGYWIYYKIKKK